MLILVNFRTNFFISTCARVDSTVYVLTTFSDRDKNAIAIGSFSCLIKTYKSYCKNWRNDVGKMFLHRSIFLVKQQVVDRGTNSAESDLVTGRIGETGHQHLLDDLHILVVFVPKHCRNGSEKRRKIVNQNGFF